MSETATTPAKQRPEFRNINAFTDLPSYRLPAAGWVSILHRVSGVMMFALMPFIIWMFDTSISSEISFTRFTNAFSVGMLGLPGFIWKLVALGLIWAYLHHFTAGLLTISLTLTVLLGAKLFGLY
jgi:succinate dehydrogenase / fumarate reductase cytochrome b subunit